MKFFKFFFVSCSSLNTNSLMSKREYLREQTLSNLFLNERIKGMRRGVVDMKELKAENSSLLKNAKKA